MTNAVSQELTARVIIKSLTQAGFPGSNLVDVYNQLKGVAGDSKDERLTEYRALFAEIESQGDVPHDASIISPAAYLTDLLRMVEHLSKHERLSDERQLRQRRPDLWELPLGAEETSTEHPYLELVNEILDARLTNLQGDDGGLADRMVELLTLHNPAVSKAAAYLEIAGGHLPELVSLPDLVSLFPGRDSARNAATLGVSYDTWKELTDPDIHKSAFEAHFDSHALVSHVSGEHAVLFLRQLGLSDEMIEYAISGTDRDNTLTSWINARFVAIPEYQSLWFEDSPTGLRLMVMDSSPTSIEDYLGYDLDGPLEDELAEAYLTAISELVRFSRLSRAMGWPALELDHVLWTLRLSAAPNDDLTTMIWLRDMRQRSELTLHQTTFVFACDAYENIFNPDRAALFFPGCAPLPVDKSNFNRFHLNDVPEWIGVATAMSPTEVHAVFLRELVFRRRQKVTETLSAATASIPEDALIDEPVEFFESLYRIAHLRLILKRPTLDILVLCDLLNVDIQWTPALVELVEYSDWINETEIPFSQIQSMAQSNDIPTCRREDLITANEAVHNHLAGISLEDSDVPDGTEVLPLDAAFAGLASYFGIDLDLLKHLLEETVESVRYSAMMDAFVQQAFDFSHESGLLAPDDAVLGFCDLQSSVLVATTFGLNAQRLLLSVDPFDPFRTPLGRPSRTPQRRSNWRNLRALRQFHKLQVLDSERGEDVGLAIEHYVKLTDEGSSVADATKLSSIDPRNTKESTTEQGNAGSNPEYRFGSSDSSLLDYCVRLNEIAKLSQRVSLDPRQLRQVAALFTPALSLHDPTSIVAARDKRDRAVDLVVAAARSKLDAAAFAHHEDEVAVKLNEARRDALARSLMLAMNRVDSPDDVRPFGLVACFQDLSNLLLVDVEMSGAAKISRVKLGLNTVQRYIRRTITNQEPDPTPFVLSQNQWTWRSHYRLWEANRKVFLFPENYLDPGLRKQKTPLFEDLEDALLQGEITDESAQRAFMGYLDALESLAEMDVVSGVAANVRAPGSTGWRNTIFFLARTKAKKPDYYLRSAVFRGPRVSHWTPWQRIVLPTHSDQMVVGYAHERVHLFWLEERSVTDQHDGVRVTRSFATLKYAHQTHSGGWSEARVMNGFDDLFVGSVTKTKTEDDSKQGIRSEPAANLSETAKVGFPEPHATVSLTVTAEVPSVDNITLPASGGESPEGARIVARLSSDRDLTTLGLHDSVPKDEQLHWTGRYSVETQWRRPEYICWPAGPELDQRFKVVRSRLGGAWVLVQFENVARKPEVAYSPDGGRNWYPRMEGIDKDYKAYDIVSSQDGEHVFLVGWPGKNAMSSLYRSSQQDRQTWRAVKPPPFDRHNDLKLAISPDGTALAAKPTYYSGGRDRFEEGAVAVSWDAGENWHTADSGDAAGLRDATDVAFAADGSLLLAKGWQAFLEYSSVERFVDREPMPSSRWSSRETNLPGRLMNLFSDGTLHMEVGGDVYRSTDNGISWAKLNEDPFNGQVQGLYETPYGAFARDVDGFRALSLPHVPEWLGIEVNSRSDWIGASLTSVGTEGRMILSFRNELLYLAFPPKTEPML